MAKIQINHVVVNLSTALHDSVHHISSDHNPANTECEVELKADVCGCVQAAVCISARTLGSYLS